MLKKTFDNKACGQNHERPINSKCTRNSASEVADNCVNIGSEQNDINLQILQELKSLSGRMTVVEQKVSATARGVGSNFWLGLRTEGTRLRLLDATVSPDRPSLMPQAFLGIFVAAI